MSCSNYLSYFWIKVYTPRVQNNVFLYLIRIINFNWGNSPSQCFINIVNRVKQGAVLSPILFSVYINVLLTRFT